MIAHKAKIFYCVCLLSSTLYLLSLFQQRNFPSQQKFVHLNLDTTVHEENANPALEKLNVLETNLLKFSTLPQYKKTIKISLDEIASSVKLISPHDLVNPKVIFLVATWRSGSTFFGEALSFHEAMYYHYEPLSFFGFQDLENPVLQNVSLQTIQSLSKCQYSKIGQYMEWIKHNDTIMLNLNNKIQRACNFLGSQDCSNVEFLTKACSYFPIQLFKVVRLRVAAFEKLINDNKAAHVVFLARDPRAILASRMKLNWCLEIPKCGEPSSLCKALETDLTSTNLLKNKYPHQVHLVKYEDLATNPTTILKTLFSDLNISWSSQIELYLQTHTTSDIENPWSTFRISQLRINHWKTTLQPAITEYVQNMCNNFMTELNYSMINVRLR